MRQPVNESVLEMLYEAYLDQNYPTSDEIRNGFQALYIATSDALIENSDPLVEIVSRLCSEHEKTGFYNGIRLGVKLCHELTSEKMIQ